jgi:hypothetical protein
MPARDSLAPHAFSRHCKALGLRAAVALLALTPATLAWPADGEWSLLLEPMYMDAFGHDQHVLTIHQRDVSATPTVDAQTPVNLDSENGLAPRFEFRYARDEWTFGVDFFWFASEQGRPTRSAASTGPGSEVVFEVADRTFTSDTPGEVLFFNVLEDTELITWTADLYALKTLAESERGNLALQFGLRNADFDNDYHHAVGIENVQGSLFDASSNYPRMIGPLLGLEGEVQYGKSTFRGYFGQSVIFGTAELTNETRDFTGPVSDAPNVVAQEFFGKEQDVAIPVTEFRVNWLYPLGRLVSLGVSVNTSVWWDVPVPPGLTPVAQGNVRFDENTILYFGLAVAVKLKI